MCTIRGHVRLFPPPARIFLAGVLLLPAVRHAPGDGVPRLRTIRFSGHSAVSAPDLRSTIQVKAGAPLTDSVIGSAVGSVRRLYAERGYIAPSIRPRLTGGATDSAVADLELEINEGEPARIGRIVFRGNHALTTAILSDLLRSRPGDIPTAGLIEEEISSVLAAYDRSGYPFARVRVADIAPAEESGSGSAGSAGLVVTLGIEEGSPVDISEFRLQGNTQTNDAVILRESRMELPVRYDPAKISRFAERLRRLGLFASVAEPEIYRTDRGEGLLLTVMEGGNNTFDGIAGYLPASPGGDGGRVTGSVSVTFRNLFGTGRKMEAGWSRDGRLTQQIRLAYSEPWAFGLPVNLSGAFFQRQQDSSYVDRSVDLEAEFLVSGSLSVSGVAGRKQIIPSEGSGAAGLRNSTTTTAGIAVRYDTRDDRALPRRGVDYRSEYRAGPKKIASAGSGDSRSVRSLGLDLDVFVPAGHRQVLDLGVHGRQISTGEPEQGDLFRLGGVRALRGFRENRFSGTRVAWGTVEYRLLTGGRTFFFGFIDPGYVYTPLTEPVELITFGYGIGVRLETALGLVGVSFALGKGDPVSETKIHFGLINDF